MPGALRVNDIDTNLDRMESGSENVKVNGLGFCRFDDPDTPSKDTINSNVSKNVFVNGRAAAYIGSIDEPGKHIKLTGSGNVFVNGKQ